MHGTLAEPVKQRRAFRIRRTQNGESKTRPMTIATDRATDLLLDVINL
jgi:hypothetical protein